MCQKDDNGEYVDHMNEKITFVNILSKNSFRKSQQTNNENI